MTISSVHYFKCINRSCIVFAIVICLLIACNGDSTNNPTAVLSVRETGNMPGMLVVDATSSSPGEGNDFTQFIILIHDEETGGQLKEVRIDKNFENSTKHMLPISNISAEKPLDESLQRKNIKGDYRITLSVITENGLIDSTETVITIGDVWLNHIDTVHNEVDTTTCVDTDIHCSVDDSDIFATCYMSDSCNVVDLTDVLLQAQSVNADANLDEESPLVIAAFGSVGADGCDGGGSGGYGGFAEVFTSINNYQLQNSHDDNPYNLYYYLGDTGTCRKFSYTHHVGSGGDGGASTIVSFTDNPSESSSYSKEEVVLVAGGGGGGSPDLGNFKTDGGNGSQSLYLSQSDYTSDDGEDVAIEYNSKTSDTCGYGGIGDLDNIGGYGGYGYSGDGNPIWLNGTAPVSDYGAGSNADYENYPDNGNPGAGGGGAGGGAAGVVVGIAGYSGDYSNCAGGGGASMVMSSDSDKQFFEFEPEGRTTYNTTGMVYFYFIDAVFVDICELDDNSRVVCTLSTDNVGNYDSISLKTLFNLAQAIDSNIQDDTPMWIQAYGSASGYVSSFAPKSYAGDGGFAQTVTTYTDFLKNENADDGQLYFYFGKQTSTSNSDNAAGGTATIVSFSSELNDSFTSEVAEKLIVIAGGGGAPAGSNYSTNGVSSAAAGNRGGVAISTSTDTVATVGVGSGKAGGGGTSCDENMACGGTNDSDDANPGNDGVGGLGGIVNDDLSSSWYNATPDLVSQSSGQGGEVSKNKLCDIGTESGASQHPGSGGGGFGGGVGGYCNDENGARPGSGGGSYALLSTQTDDDAPTSAPDYSGSGKVVITFNPN